VLRVNLKTNSAVGNSQSAHAMLAWRLIHEACCLRQRDIATQHELHTTISMTPASQPIDASSDMITKNRTVLHHKLPHPLRTERSPSSPAARNKRPPDKHQSSPQPPNPPSAGKGGGATLILPFCGSVLPLAALRSASHRYLCRPT
jgi:hypothetical protein